MSWRVVGTLALMSWGALAFGGVYPWGYLPLYAGCALVGTVALLQRKGAAQMDLILAASLALVVVAIGAQLVPVPVNTIRQLSPETDAALRHLDVGYPAAVRHALSIKPYATSIVLVAALALGIFVLGLARTLTRHDAPQIARGMTALGVVLAVAGVAQKALWNGKIYGFWTPIAATDSFSSFGPFVNKNHFAGWMLMALPLAVGYFCGRVARGMRHVKPGLRNRIIWFSSADASETIMVGVAAILMALALVLTMSRSGMSAGMLSLAIAGAFVVRRQSGVRRGAAIAYLVLLVVLVLGWVGTGAIASRFSSADWHELDSRRGAWKDAAAIAARFPLFGTGLDTYGAVTVLYQQHDLDHHYNEAHNDYLQLAAEGGLLVAVPAAILAGIFIAAVWRRFSLETSTSTYWLRVGAVTGLAAISLQEAVEFSLQMPGNAVLFAVLCGVALHQSPSEVQPATTVLRPRPIVARPSGQRGVSTRTAGCINPCERLTALTVAAR